MLVALNLTSEIRKRYVDHVVVHSHSMKDSVNLETSPRIACFSDTFGFQTNNGVGRFLENLRQYSSDANLPIQFFVPGRDADCHDIRFIRAPSFSVPGYPDLKIYMPLEHQRKQIAHEIKKWKPDVIHVSTPGPLGLLGVSLSQELKLPLLGIYHTDFPEYARSIVESQLLSIMEQSQQPWNHPLVKTLSPWVQKYLMPQLMKLMIGNPNWMDDAKTLKEIGGRNIKLLTGDLDWKENLGHLAGKCTAIALRQFYSRFSVVVARSASQIDQITTSLGIEKERIRCLVPGIDVERFSPDHRQPSIWEALPVTNNAFKALYVGRITSEKNFSFLIETWKQLKLIESSSPADANIELVVVGRGEAKLIEQIKELPSVHVIGAKRGETLSQIYASSDVLLFPSITETLGQVGLEACASGLPVIASDQGGPKMYIDHESSGFVLPIESPEIWANTILKLAHNRERRQQISEAARTKIAEQFSFASSLKSYAEIHREAIELNEEQQKKKKQRLVKLKRPQLTTQQLSRRGLLVITDYHAGKRYGNAKNRLQKLASIESMLTLAVESNLDVVFGGDFGDHGAKPERSEADFKMLRDVQDKVGLTRRPLLIRGNHDYGFTDEQLSELANCEVSTSLIYRHPESRVTVTHGHILGLQRVIDMLTENQGYENLESNLNEEKLDADLKPSVIAYDLANLAESMMQKRGLTGLGAFWEGLYDYRSKFAENVLKLGGQDAERMDDRTWKLIASLVGTHDDVSTAALLGDACDSWATIFGHTHEPLARTIKQSESVQLVANAGCINRKSPTCVVARFPEVRVLRFSHETGCLQLRNHVWLDRDSAGRYESNHFSNLTPVAGDSISLEGELHQAK